MRHEEFIGQVQHRAHLSGHGEAERATRATLETLGERIPEGLADNLAAQLPHEIGENLRRTEVYGGAGSGERFDRHDFIARIAARSGADESQAAFLARAVLEVTEEASQGAVMNKVYESLSPDIRQLVTSGTSG
jgi:uncharacterized protein (DUF2267 family)